MKLLNQKGVKVVKRLDWTKVTIPNSFMKGDGFVKKRQVNVRLTEFGIMKLEELRRYFGFNQSAMVELLITLQYEKIILRKEEPPDEEKKCKLSG